MAECYSGIEHVSALVFSVNGVGIGVDTDQISGMADAKKIGENDCRLISINELLGLGASGAGVNDCAHPKVLFLKGYLPGHAAEDGTGAMRRIGVAVNQPEEIVDIPVAVMRPMPQLLAPHGDLNGLWAVALMNGAMIFMMDIRKTIGSKMGEVVWLGGK